MLLPAVREAPKHALVITDGFSCRSQIEHGTDRRPLHLAEVVWMALRAGGRGPGGEYPERAAAVLGMDATHRREPFGGAVPDR